MLIAGLLLALNACGWVDSTGSQPEITQLGATGNADDNTVSLVEETQKILDFADYTNASGDLLQTIGWTAIDEGALAECSSVFDISKAADTLVGACAPGETSCDLLIVPVTADGTDQYSLLPPRLALPVGVKYDWALQTESGIEEHVDVTFCIDAVNEAPVASNDVYAVPFGGVFELGGYQFDENCQHAANESSIMDNDSDDGDWRKGCLQAILVSQPTYARNNFELGFTSGGGFSYEHNPAVGNTEDRFTYRVFDGEYYSESVTVLLSVANNLVAPTAVPDQYNVQINSTGNVFFPMSNDLDPQAIDIDIVRIAQQPDQGGSALLLGTNRIIYSPANQYSGIETIQYTISNATGQESTGIIRIFVN